MEPIDDDHFELVKDGHIADFQLDGLIYKLPKTITYEKTVTTDDDIKTVWDCTDHIALIPSTGVMGNHCIGVFPMEKTSEGWESGPLLFEVMHSRNAFFQLKHDYLDWNVSWWDE